MALTRQSVSGGSKAKPSGAVAAVPEAQASHSFYGARGAVPRLTPQAQLEQLREGRLSYGRSSKPLDTPLRQEGACGRAWLAWEAPSRLYLPAH